MEVQEGDYDGLVAVIRHLLSVRDRQPNTDGMFDPLKQTIELLKTYNQNLPDEVYQQLEVSGQICTSKWLRMFLTLAVLNKSL